MCRSMYRSNGCWYDTIHIDIIDTKIEERLFMLTNIELSYQNDTFRLCHHCMFAHIVLVLERVEIRGRSCNEKFIIRGKNLDGAEVGVKK